MEQRLHRTVSTVHMGEGTWGRGLFKPQNWPVGQGLETPTLDHNYSYQHDTHSLFSLGNPAEELSLTMEKQLVVHNMETLPLDLRHLALS